MGKILGIKQFLQERKKAMDFSGSFYHLLGRPEPQGAWIIWGQSGSGKTTFTCRLAKYLAEFGRVAYLSLEEGDSLSLQRSFQDAGMMEVNGRVVLLDMNFDEMVEKLAKPKSWDIVIIDSLQYARIDYDTYRDLRSRFPRKLFIFISHADGKDPKGGVADSIRYDCSCKIYVEGFRAVAASRYLDHGQKSHPFIIWEEKAVLYYGQDFDQVK